MQGAQVRPGVVDLVAFLAALAAAAAVVAAQPLSGPWWDNADADATYTGSALNLAAGGHTRYFDHPGLPLQEAGAAAFALWHGADAVIGSAPSMHAFSADLLLHLDRTRPVFRGIAVLVYFLGVAAVFLAGRAALGGGLWGLAAVFLWLFAPGLSSMSIQFRPDVMLSWLCLVAGVMLVRGYERRAAFPLLAAAATIGFTVMTKLHAVGLIPSLFLASFIAGPFPGWAAEARAWLDRKRRLLLVALAAWLAAAVYFDSSRIPFHPNAKGIAVLAALVVAAAVWYALGRQSRHTASIGSVTSSFNGVLIAGVVAGALAPILVVADDGLRSLPWIVDAVLGRGVNNGVGSLSNFGLFVHRPLVWVLVLLALTAVEAIVGATHRDWSGALWLLAGLMMAGLAIGRLGTTHYFAPAYALGIIPSLRLARRAPGAVPPLAVVGLVASIAVAQMSHLAPRAEKSSPDNRRAYSTLADAILRPGQAAITDPSAPLPDTLYASLVATYVDWIPPYPFRTVPSTPVGEWLLGAEHLHPRYYFTFLAPDVSRVGDYTISLQTPQHAGAVLAYRLISGPGVDRPLPTSPPPAAPRLSPG